METNKTPKMPFDKKGFGMPAGSSFCCGSFMEKMMKSASCCDAADGKDEAGCESDPSSNQGESGSETKEEQTQ